MPTGWSVRFVLERNNDSNDVTPTSAHNTRFWRSRYREAMLPRCHADFLVQRQLCSRAAPRTVQRGAVAILSVISTNNGLKTVTNFSAQHDARPHNTVAGSTTLLWYTCPARAASWRATCACASNWLLSKCLCKSAIARNLTTCRGVTLFEELFVPHHPFSSQLFSHSSGQLSVNRSSLWSLRHETSSSLARLLWSLWNALAAATSTFSLARSVAELPIGNKSSESSVQRL